MLHKPSQQALIFALSSIFKSYWIPNKAAKYDGSGVTETFKKKKWAISLQAIVIEFLMLQRKSMMFLKILDDHDHTVTNN